MTSQAWRPCPSTLRLAFLFPSPQGSTTRAVSQHNTSGHHTPGYVVHSHDACGWTCPIRTSLRTYSCMSPWYVRKAVWCSSREEEAAYHTHTHRTFRQHSKDTALGCWLMELERVLYMCVCGGGGGRVGVGSCRTTPRRITQLMGSHVHPPGCL